jgi:hypothetical protein
MKFLKRYKIFEALFNTSDLEDILIDLKDNGYGWSIDARKTSENKSLIILNIYITKFLPQDKEKEYIEDLNCLIRCDHYLRSEGFMSKGFTEEKVDSIKNSRFFPDKYITGWPDPGDSIDYDSIDEYPSLELQYEMKN